MSLELSVIENDVHGIGSHFTPMELAEKISLVDAAKQRIKQIADALEAALIAWIQEHGDLEIGTIRYYVGERKVTKCVDVPDTVQELLIACGGDMNAFCECLASGAIKHGAAGKVLSRETWERMFVVESSDELREGKPKLQKIDTKFLR